jgi:hypothetical protein
MLRRHSRVRVVTAVAVFATLAALVSTPVAAATVPVSTAPSVMLPDTSAATAGSVVGAAARAAVPSVAQAPARAAAAPPPPVFLSDSYCSYAGFNLKTLLGLDAACGDPVFGSYDPLDNCFWKELQPQPPAGDPLWQGQSSAPPAKLYTVTCETHNGNNIGNAAATIEYSTQPPLNYKQAPLSFVQQAALNLFVQTLALAPVPETGTEPPSAPTAPPPGKGGVVGLPSWMWADIPSGIWDQWTFNKNVFLVGKVSLVFEGQQVDWDMGDGNHVICATPGSAYVKPTPPNVAYKNYSGPPGPSPDCPYTYANAGTYGVTSTATWFLSFQVGTTTGTFVVSRTTKIKFLTIGELQAVTE